MEEPQKSPQEKPDDLIPGEVPNGNGRSMMTPEDNEKYAQTRAKVMQLRASGFSFAQIGKAMGFSRQRAYAIFKDEIRSIREESGEALEEMRAVANERLNTMISRLWMHAVPNDPKTVPNMEAVTLLLRAMGQHAKIMGYESPRKVNIDVNQINSQVNFLVTKIVEVIPAEHQARVLEAVEQSLSNMNNQASRPGELAKVSGRREVVAAGDGG